MKDICSQEEGDLSSADIFRTRGRGVLQMRTSALFWAKTSDFSKFIVCPHGQRGREVEPVRTFFGQGGREINFLRFCENVLYGRRTSYKWFPEKNKNWGTFVYPTNFKL